MLQGNTNLMMAGGSTAGALGWALAGLALWALSAVWTLGAAIWGALRLVSGRPMGQSGAGRALEIR
jgi:hypothetical protein